MTFIKEFNFLTSPSDLDLTGDILDIPSGRVRSDFGQI